MPNVFEDLKAGRDRLNAYHESYQQWRHDKDSLASAGKSQPASSDDTRPNTQRPDSRPDTRRWTSPPRHEPGGAGARDDYLAPEPAPGRARSHSASSSSQLPEKHTGAAAAPAEAAGPPRGAPPSYTHAQAAPDASGAPPPPPRRPLADPHSFPPPPVEGNARPTPQQAEAKQQANKFKFASNDVDKLSTHEY